MARVLLFGRLADIAGWREREMELAGRVSDLRAALAAETPGLSALSGDEIRVAVDQAMVGGDPSVMGAAEVAFLPPFSGG
jgi:sulfur-carrier protein